MTDDALLFSDDDFTDMPPAPVEKRWRVLLVDDEPEVHAVTKLVLSDFEFDGGALEFVSAKSAAEAKDILLQAKDGEFAVALVDVVMETEHAGLDLVQWVREDLDNHRIRLILRTGQPGEAPEESIIRTYDINDYKNKTELTALRLKTLFFSALRGYRDILTIDQHRVGLEKIIAATTQFIACDTLKEFASAILTQVTVVLGMEGSEILCCAVMREQEESDEYIHVLASNHDDVKQPGDRSIIKPGTLRKRLERAIEKQTSVYGDAYFVGYFTTQRGTENLLYVAREGKLTPVQHHLLEFFANNIAVAHENLKLREVIKESQKELSYVIGEAVELRSKETGSHVRRVAHTSERLAQLYGLSEREAEMIKLASPLHDVGKVGIPDRVLNKPAKLNDEEWEIMKTHAQIGFEMLSRSDNPILQLGAVIAHQHHEKWDGSGYPRGLEHRDIDIAGRITALADVFDALGSKRCYKEPWPNEKILNLLLSERGKHFEPRLVDLLLDNIEDFLAIQAAYPDPVELAH